MWWVDGKLKRIPYLIPSGPGEELLLVLASVALTRPGTMMDVSNGTVKEFASCCDPAQMIPVDGVWGGVGRRVENVSNFL